MCLNTTSPQVPIHKQRLPESDNLPVGSSNLIVLPHDLGRHGRDDLLVLRVLVRLHVDQAYQKGTLDVEALLKLLSLGRQSGIELLLGEHPCHVGC